MHPRRSIFISLLYFCLLADSVEAFERSVWAVEMLMA